MYIYVYVCNVLVINNTPAHYIYMYLCAHVMYFSCLVLGAVSMAVHGEEELSSSEIPQLAARLQRLPDHVHNALCELHSRSTIVMVAEGLHCQWLSADEMCLCVLILLPWNHVVLSVLHHMGIGVM